MLTKIITWLSIGALLVAVVSRASAGYQLLAEYVVCAGALLVALQLQRAERYVWAVAFVAIAMLFNPFVPVILTRTIVLWLNVVCVATFMISLVLVKAPQQTPSVSQLLYGLGETSNRPK